MKPEEGAQRDRKSIAGAGKAAKDQRTARTSQRKSPEQRDFAKAAKNSRHTPTPAGNKPADESTLPPESPQEHTQLHKTSG